MRKMLIPVAILLVTIFVITGCSGGATTSPAATTPAVVASTSATVAATKPAATTSAPPSSTAASPVASKPPATTAAAGTPRYGGTLRYIAPTGPGAPIGAPWLANGTSTFVMQFAEEFLIKEQYDASLKPGLATTWDVVNDPANPSITLHLQKGVKFSDGTDFNAQAVKWNLGMSMTPGSSTYGSTTNWKSVDVIDDYTVRINLKTFTNTSLPGFASSVAFMVSPSAYQKNGADWMNFNMVGTGPFVQTNFQRDVSLTLTKNTNYYVQGKPYLNGVQMLFVTDPLTGEALFKSGGAEIIQCTDDAMANRLQTAGFNIQRVASYGGSLVPDSANADSPWSNLKVRQAAEYAIDKVALANRFGYGTWQAAYQSNGSASPAYDSVLTPRAYDVAKAKQLMTDAGYPNGFKTTLIVGATGVNSDVAVAIQAYWNAVGIQAALQYPQTAAWSNYLTGGTWKNGVLYGAAPGYSSPNVAWSNTYSQGSAWYLSMKRPDGWYPAFTAALATPQLDPTLEKNCEDLLYNDVNTIPLYFSAKQWGVVPSVQDAGLGTRGLWAWFEPQNTWLSP
jgi:peptide/nickel transport system substrate-binding protein